MNYSLNIKAEEIKEENMKEGRISLGVVEVELGRIFIFGAKQQLHEMVSFIPGLGNGAYEVFAEIKYVPGRGYRTTKIEIACVTEEELLHYEKELADQVLEVAY